MSKNAPFRGNRRRVPKSRRKGHAEINRNISSVRLEKATLRLGSHRFYNNSGKITIKPSMIRTVRGRN